MRSFRFGAILLCLVLSLPALHGQGNCTLVNIAGTYAFSFTGTSAMITGPAPDAFHWNALYAPIAGVGIYTIKPNGTATGKYWLVAGAMNLGLDPVPWDAVITLNSDCTGSMESKFNEAVLKERFVIVGNGREIRSVATQTAMPTGNWLTTAYRIGGSCGQNKVRGDYLFECKNLFPLPVPPPDPSIFGGAIHIRMKIAPGGDYTASVYGKVGPDSTPFDAFGHVTVNNDCTAEGTLASFLPTISHARGVFFNEGKQGFWLPLVGELPDKSTVNQPYGYCTITLIDNK
jgi:hypothetical protein